MELGIQALAAPLVLSIAALLVMMQIAFWRHTLVSWVISCGALVLAMLAIIPMAEIVPQSITVLLVSDQYSLFFSLLILFTTLITALLAKGYLHDRAGENEEFYLLLILSALGALILVSATHLVSFFLGLELLGVALYALIAYPERGHLSLEAAIKYLVLSGAASAILLFGFAMIYAALGTLSFAGIGQQLAQLSTQPLQADTQLLIMMGTAMVFTGVGFKLSLVPFHMWTPDVYQGAPSPVTGFLATVSKGAIFAALMRLFIDAQLYQYQGLMVGLSVLAVASMLVGNLLALKQSNLKRLLAYSSIAHLGYLFITLIVYGVLQQPALAVEAAGFYLTAYIITSLAAFSLLSIISSNTNGVEVDDISQIRGLFWRQPLLALMLTIAMLSLAGIPLTVGFIGKFYLFTAGIQGALWLLLAALVIGSGIGIYYYLRVVFAMSMNEGDVKSNSSEQMRFSWIAKIVVCLLIFMMLYLGVLPQSLMQHLGGLV
ncbi:MAG: NADH-quinone oxidoreductase subunit N [Proteobacteria bacterium]|jgi:NADH-quinone oxidoreductase subunit N|nr:NADH-quinone oxidoreductase subunit N [Pseudomonadota bacterium]